MASKRPKKLPAKEARVAKLVQARNERARKVQVDFEESEAELDVAKLVLLTAERVDEAMVEGVITAAMRFALASVVLKCQRGDQSAHEYRNYLFEVERPL